VIDNEFPERDSVYDFGSILRIHSEDFDVALMNRLSADLKRSCVQVAVPAVFSEQAGKPLSILLVVRSDEFIDHFAVPLHIHHHQGRPFRAL
jgi:hypothetical protein